uniref:Uncharacterized protein n=1 Tax=Candidatus Methanogaster sp. ANME-2c ERB4 TaxID=2759911 RepID=A0A7G9YKA8_9EURY|nr:hypothetical protein BMBEPEAL_00006 [Methanosarcinales archaeon ANME-2c ERB4]
MRKLAIQALYFSAGFGDLIGRAMREKAEMVMHDLKSKNAMIIVIYTLISFSAIVAGHYTANTYFSETMPWAVNVTIFVTTHLHRRME